MSHDDFAFEPVRGLPAALPPGERLLWQGAPQWRTLAVRAYHVRKVAIYFGVLMLWRLVSGLRDGHAMRDLLLSCAFLALLGAVACAVLAGLAWLNARGTVYSITNRRILIRHGIAVPITLNLPLRLIDNAALKSFSNGHGELALTLERQERVGYLVTWPHVRDGRFTRPEPCLRALQEPAKVAALLGAALSAEAGTAAARPEPPRVRSTASRPATAHSAAA